VMKTAMAALTSTVALATTRHTTRREVTGGRADERGGGWADYERARVHAHARCSKCTGLIRLEKIGCVSTAARLLSSMTRLADPYVTSKR